MSAQHTPMERYEVTRDGRVLSYTRWLDLRELARDINDDGYPCVRVVINGRRRRVPVHKLVAQQFHGPQPAPGYEVRHLDGDKLNPHADNLAWGTRKQNADDRERHGRTSRGAEHSSRITAALSARHPGESSGEWEIRRYARTSAELYTVSKPAGTKRRLHLEYASDGRPMLYGIESARAAIAKATGAAS